MFRRLLRDEQGFVVSAELVLIATLMILGLLVGMAEIQQAMVGELNDVGDAMGRLNQTYSCTGFSAFKRYRSGRLKSFTRGSAYFDRLDECDRNECSLSCNPPVNEIPKSSSGYPSRWDYACDRPTYCQ